MREQKAPLPQWQRTPSTVYPKRSSAIRRYRLLIVLALVCFTWYHFSRTSEPANVAIERSIDWESKELERSIPRPAPAVQNRAEPQDVDLAPPLPRQPSPQISMATQESQDVRNNVNLPSAGIISQLSSHDSPPEEGVYDGTLPASVKEASQKIIEQHLSPALKHVPEQTEARLPSSERLTDRFPTYSEYARLDEDAETLPDIIHVPFEESTADIVLTGWEDLWFSEATYDSSRWGSLREPSIDFVFTWVNGSDEAFQATIRPYEINSTLNDQEGSWLAAHGVNRYRDWDELRYAVRSVEHYASSFRNKIQLLVNSVVDPKQVNQAVDLEEPAYIAGKQSPLWLNQGPQRKESFQVLAQEEFFAVPEALPTFNSLTIENQIFNVPSNTDRFFAMSDDMLLGKPHSAADIYSPLFGTVIGFKSNAYNTVNPPTDLDARRFGEKPFLIYTSWLLNRRFGERKRKGQSHFGHSMSRSVTKEAINSFPRPAAQSIYQRFRGESGFQLYSWYATFHYTIERHREALLWSYIMQRSDLNGDGNLDWVERQNIIEDLEQGMRHEGRLQRKRMFYNTGAALEAAGLQAPKVNVDVQWTSLDGPIAIRDIECFEFNVNECLAPGFSTPNSDENYSNYIFSTASILDRVARQYPKCGDCLMKLLLNRQKKGLEPLLPRKATQSKPRDTVVKALWKYQYTIVEPDAWFVMVTDAEQVENLVYKRLVAEQRSVGQLCLNDDVGTDLEEDIVEVKRKVKMLLEGLLPNPSPYEL